MNDEQLNDEKLLLNFKKQIKVDCQQPWSDSMTETTLKDLKGSQCFRANN